MPAWAEVMGVSAAAASAGSLQPNTALYLTGTLGEAPATSHISPQTPWVWSHCPESLGHCLWLQGAAALQFLRGHTRNGQHGEHRNYWRPRASGSKGQYRTAGGTAQGVAALGKGIWRRRKNGRDGAEE